jgi:hypothetical protein
MEPIDAIRWLEFEAKRCRGRDACEALCLLLPALRTVLDVPPMEDCEAAAFRERVKGALQSDLKKAA